MRVRDPLQNPEPLIRRVYGYVAYRIGAGPDAEDVTSEVFERAVRYRESYDPAKGTPLGWLVGIARRTIEGTVSAPRHDPIEDYDAAAAVAELRERDRELIALRYGADLTVSQIAALLDMRTNSAEVALHRALARARDKLEGRAPADAVAAGAEDRPVRVQGHGAVVEVGTSIRGEGG